MSRSHFHFMFRTLTGRTLMDFVTRVRVRAALRLLQETDVPISQLALDCGFPTSSCFYRAFKTVHNKTPRSIRIGASGSSS
jgi:AraC-like DNA-binding protein